MGASSHKTKPRPEDPDNLHELVKEAQNGSSEAFGELVTHYNTRLYNVVYRFLGHRDDAMEVTQQVWLKAWRRRASFRGESGFFTWLYRIANYSCIDFIRKRQRKPEDILDPDIPPERALGAESAPSSDTRPDTAAEHAEIRQVFNRLLQELTPEHRMALVLREVEGLSYDEISKAMRCRRGTVMSRIYYARKTLQEKMKDLL